MRLKKEVSRVVYPRVMLEPFGVFFLCFCVLLLGKMLLVHVLTLVSIFFG